MPPQALPDFLKPLPELLQAVLQHEENGAINQAIIEKHGLSDDQADQLINIIRKIIQQAAKPAETVANIEHDLGLNEESAKSLALDLLGWRLLPMEWYIGGVSNEIRKLGGSPEAFIEMIAPLYPEVYGELLAESAAPTTVEALPEVESALEPTILHDIDDRLLTNKGRAEVLLRMTALSQQIEDAGKAKQLDEVETQALMHTLDALSYAVNTKDLNLLEIAAIKRRLKSILAKLPVT